MPRPRTITLAEFEGVYASPAGSPAREEAGIYPIEPERFDQLKELAITMADKADPDTGAPVLSLSARRGVRKVVSVRNYVGVIAFSSGDRIEVLPKIARSLGLPGSPERTRNEEALRRTFLGMLREAWDVDAKAFSPTDLALARLPVFEAFIRMFLDVAALLVKRGLPGGYTRIENNERVFRGKLLVAEHLRHNLVRKDRFFVAHDVFSLDNPANRILRSGLQWVVAHAAADSNRTAARRLLGAFESVPASANLAGDFGACAAAQRDALCRKALDWCRVFLYGQSIANLPGTQHAQALLFPMETIFERFVARRLARAAASSGVRVSAQERSLHLFEESSCGKTFRLQPDIVLRRTDSAASLAPPVVVDTKWKRLIDAPARHYGISQADMYQMVAYQKRYGARSVLLVYPRHDDLGRLASAPPFFRTPGDIDVHVVFFDLNNPDASVETLLEKSGLSHFQKLA